MSRASVGLEAARRSLRPLRTCAAPTLPAPAATSLPLSVHQHPSCLALPLPVVPARSLLKSALGLGPRYRVVLVMPSGGQLAQVADLYRQGKLKPVVAQVFPLEQAAQAQDLLKQGHTRGKIVLRVGEPAAG